MILEVTIVILHFLQERFKNVLWSSPKTTPRRVDFRLFCTRVQKNVDIGCFKRLKTTFFGVSCFSDFQKNDVFFPEKRKIYDARHVNCAVFVCWVFKRAHRKKATQLSNDRQRGLFCFLLTLVVTVDSYTMGDTLLSVFV